MRYRSIQHSTGDAKESPKPTSRLKQWLWRRYDKEKAKKNQPTSSNNSRDWIKGVVICAWIIAVVLTLNIILTIIAVALVYTKNSAQGFSFASLYTGKCSVAKGWSTGLHVVINILSTAMLGASNYCMQCLASPSRAEVDDAHRQRTWLSIGVPNIFDLLLYKKGKRRLLGFILLITSLPIHLIYNSAAYFSLGPSEYAVVLAQANHSLANISLPQNNADYGQCFEENVGVNISTFRTAMADEKFKMLSKQECINTFAQDYVSGQRMVILLTNASLPGNEPLVYMGKGNAESFSEKDRSVHQWLCDNNFECTKAMAEKSINDWSVHGSSWSIPNVLLSVPTPSGFQSVSAGSGLIPGKYGIPDTEDYRHLHGILMTFPDEKKLRADLDNPAIWVNGSFSRNVKIQGHEAKCGYKDSRIPQPSQKYQIGHCLSLPAEETCQLFFSLPICLTVICCTIIKLICTILTARDNREEIFLTVGDAIASFITRPDPATKGACLLSKSLVEKRTQGWRKSQGARREYPELFLCKELPRHLPPRERWFKAVSKTRWLGMLTVCAVILGPSGFLLRLAITEFKAAYGSQSIWTYGFGKVGAATLITGMSGIDLPGKAGGVLSMVLLANAPQLLISIAYFMYNALLTCILIAVEYDDYAIERKHLRVSWPRGDQRSTYYLSLPYRYSIPLLVASALLHWLVSQSIFFVEIVPFDLHGVQNAWEVVSCGYSPVAIIFAIFVGSALVLAAVFLGFRRFRSRMPLAVQCSAAISAACHPLTEGDHDRDHALNPVQWGELPGSSVYDRIDSIRSTVDLEPRGDGPIVGNDAERQLLSNVHMDRPATSGSFFFHCSFTSEDVNEPSKSRLYM